MCSNLVSVFNERLNRCKTAFRLLCVALEEDAPMYERLAEFTTRNKKHGCHSIEDVGLEYALIAFEKDSDDIASYMGFDHAQGEHDGVEVNAIVFQFSCTTPEYGRRGLSVLLRLLIIAIAIEQGFTSVISSTNDKSGPLLVEKFGFKKIDDYIPGVEYEFLPEVYVTGGIIINTKLILQEEYLEKYHKLYESLEGCGLVK